MQISIKFSKVIVHQSRCISILCRFKIKLLFNSQYNTYFVCLSDWTLSSVSILAQLLPVLSLSLFHSVSPGLLFLSSIVLKSRLSQALVQLESWYGSQKIVQQNKL